MVRMVVMMTSKKKFLNKALMPKYKKFVHTYMNLIFTYRQCLSIDIFSIIRIKEAKMEMRFEEKDRGAYHHHRSGPRPDGEPKAPIGTKMKFVNQCGYRGRESIPIKYKLWKKNKKTMIIP